MYSTLKFIKMIQNFPAFISVIFAITSVLTLLLLFFAIRNSTLDTTRKKATPLFIVLTLWLIIQAIISFKNIYVNDINNLPPKFFLVGVLPTLITIILLFVTRSGRSFIDSLPIKNLTYLSVVRIPVEIVLFWLFANKTIPELMTFEGRNFDIVAGITAPVIAYFGFTKKRICRKIILVWNLICLGLLINIVAIAILSLPSPIQKLGFDQPNIAVLYFPFSWLPTFIVPIVLLSHLASIRQLLNKR